MERPHILPRMMCHIIDTNAPFSTVRMFESPESPTSHFWTNCIRKKQIGRRMDSATHFWTNCIRKTKRRQRNGFCPSPNSFPYMEFSQYENQFVLVVYFAYHTKLLFIFCNTHKQLLTRRYWRERNLLPPQLFFHIKTQHRLYRKNQVS
jgi:hypothetical protein